MSTPERRRELAKERERERELYLQRLDEERAELEERKRRDYLRCAVAEAETFETLREAVLAWIDDKSGY